MQRVNLSSDSAKAMLDAGMTVAEIADHVGCSRGTIYWRLQEIGIHLPPGRRKKHVNPYNEFDVDKLKDVIAEGAIKRHTRDLCLFRGNMSPARAEQRWNFVVAMYLAEVETVFAGQRLSAEHECSHLCGLHTPWRSDSMWGYMSRLLIVDKPLDLIPGLREFVEYLCPRPFQLDPISRFSPWSTREWRKEPRKRQNIKGRHAHSHEIDYPFVVSVPTKEHELLMAVHKAVPRGIHKQIRGDICQDILVAVLSGDLSVGDLGEEGKIREYIKRGYKEMPDRYGHVSFDAPLFGDDGRTLHDILSE